MLGGQFRDAEAVDQAIVHWGGSATVRGTWLAGEPPNATAAAGVMMIVSAKPAAATNRGATYGADISHFLVFMPRWLPQLSLQIRAPSDRGRDFFRRIDECEATFGSQLDLRQPVSQYK
jgi:hypothetical protein